MSKIRLRRMNRVVKIGLASLLAGTICFTSACSKSAVGQGNPNSQTPSPSQAQTPTAAPTSTSKPTPVEVSLSIAEATGRKTLLPSSQVKITVTNGIPIGVVAKDEDGEEYPGKLSDGVWTPYGSFPDEDVITFTVRISDSTGNPVEKSASLKTASVKKERFNLQFMNRKVGGAMPVIITFNRAIGKEYRAGIERNLKVESTSAQEGSWGWVRGGYAVMYRPKEQWKAGATVKVNVNLKGVQASKDSYFGASESGTMTIGPNRSAKVDIAKHRIYLYENGKEIANYPATTGNSKYPTRSGAKVITEKNAKMVMDSATVGIPKGDPDYYKLDVYWAMRVTNTGEFIHAAPWSASSHGKENVSHGCTGLGTENAKRTYNFLSVGDLVTFTGSNRPTRDNEAITVWQYSWNDWKKLSAL